MDGEDVLEADQNTGDEDVAAFLVGVLREKPLRAEVQLQSAARTIRDLARSSKVLTHYYQRCLDRVAGNQIILRQPEPASSFQGRLRVEKHIRLPRRRGAKTKRSSTPGKDCTLIQASNDGHPDPCPNKKYTGPWTTTPDELSLSSQQVSNSRGATKPYRCIYCDKRFATKGNTRKHIETQHVSKKFQQCSGCGERSSSIPKAVHHSKICLQADKRTNITPFDEARDERKVYGSEFAIRYFTNRREYVDHLLYLSERLMNSPLPTPAPCIRFKFNALLGQPVIKMELLNLSQEWFGVALDLRQLVWSEDEMENAIHVLEMGIIDVEPGPPAALRRHTVRPFLERLVMSHQHGYPTITSQASFEPGQYGPSMHVSGDPEHWTSCDDHDDAIPHNNAPYSSNGSHNRQSGVSGVQAEGLWNGGEFGAERVLHGWDAPNTAVSNSANTNPVHYPEWISAQARTVNTGMNTQANVPPTAQLDQSGVNPRISSYPAMQSSSCNYQLASFTERQDHCSDIHVSQSATAFVPLQTLPHSAPSSSRFQASQKPMHWVRYMQ